MERESTPIEVFISYAHEDESLQMQLERHLLHLQRQGLITAWHDRQILAGEVAETMIETHLNSASVILLLISTGFLSSDYCYGVEMRRALERHARGEALVIPILLRPTYWQDTPFADLMVLPGNGRAITMWDNQDEAFLDVVRGIQRAIQGLVLSKVKTLTPRRSFAEHLQEERTRREWSQEELAERVGVSAMTIQRWENGQTLPRTHLYQKLNEILRINAEELGLTLALRREARPLTVHEQIATSYESSSEVRAPSGRVPLAERATIPSTNAWWDTWTRRSYQVAGTILLHLRQYQMALALYEKALLIEPDNPTLSLGKGEALLGLQRSEEAIAAYEQVLRLDPHSIAANKGQGRAYEQRAEQVFETMKQQAQECHTRARELGAE